VDLVRAEANPALLILAGYWPTRQNPISGIFIVQQAAAFAAKGIRCDVLVQVTRFRGGQDLLSTEELGLDGVMISLIEVPEFRLPEKLSSLPGAIRLNSWMIGRELSQVLRKLAEVTEYAGCIVHGVRYAGFCLSQWRRWLKCPVVAVLHGVDPFMVAPRNRSRVRNMLSREGEFIGSLVLVGRPLRTHAEAIGLSEVTQRIIANGVVLPAKPEPRVSMEEVARPIRILSVSNLIPLKGIDDNLHALARIEQKHPRLNWEYVIVGDGSIRGELEHLTQTLGLSTRVRFQGRLSYEATQMQMGQADIFSLPSWNEAFGIVYLEAMARGVPVIGCLENGAAEIVTAGRDGLLIRPKSVEDLVVALFELLSDPECRLRLGVEARNTAEGFSWGRNVDDMLAVLGIS